MIAIGIWQNNETIAKFKYKYLMLIKKKSYKP